MSLSIADRRKLLFTPCATKAHFQSWIKLFIDIDLPDCTVSEESNSNPLDNIWECYDRLYRNDLEGFSRLMAYAGRGGFKTLGAAILESMVLLHTRRNIGHMAATIPQSRKSASYVKEFFRKIILKDFVVGDNAFGVKIIHHTHRKTGDVLPDDEFSALPPANQLEFERCENYLKIVVCTLAGSQSDHVEFFVIDELDVVPKANIGPYYLAQNIPDPRDGMLPLTILTSTRKFRTGLVQRELDEGEAKGLIVRHWNLVDVTEVCPPSLHRPEEPKATYYVNDDLVKHITSDEFGVMNPGQQKSWYPVEGFGGCRGCRLFPACKGRLATHQTSTSKMLKPIVWVLGKIKNAPSPEFISTEYLCRKAEATGLVYPRLTAERHKRTASQMAEMIDGHPHPEDFGKADLIRLLKERGADFGAGMDFGYSHNFAVSTFATYGQYVFILDCYSQAGLQLDEQTANSEYLKKVYGNPPVWADPAYPGSIVTFRTREFHMRDWEKRPFSVMAGIEIVRTLLWSGSGKVRMFFLKGDSGVEFLFTRMEKYKFTVDASGKPTEVPDDTDDDENDSLRYGIMNSHGREGALKEKKSAIVQEATAPQTRESQAKQDVQAKPNAQQNWLVSEISQMTGKSITIENGSVKAGLRKGRFVFSQE